MAETDIYIRILKKRWWIIFLILVISISISIYFTRRQPRLYRAYSMIALVPNSKVNKISDVIRSLEVLKNETVIATLAKIPTTRETYRSAMKKMEIKSDNFRGYSVSSSILPNTNIIRIKVVGPDPKKAARLANTISEITKHETREMYQVLKMVDIARAVPGHTPIHPDLKRNLLVAGIVGLSIGFITAFIVEYFREPGSRAQSRS